MTKKINKYNTNQEPRTVSVNTLQSFQYEVDFILHCMFYTADAKRQSPVLKNKANAKVPKCAVPPMTIRLA